MSAPGARADPGPPPRVLAAGDAALTIEFGRAIDPAVAARVARLDRRVAALVAAGALPGVVETVPTFRSLAVLIDPLVTDPETVAARLLGSDEAGVGIDAPRDAPRDADARHADARDVRAPEPVPRLWTLPVRYGGEHGPDLDAVARATGLSADEVIDLHAGTEVGVYMLGFLPGYAFLGDTDVRLRLPRRDEPRTRVPAGSVAVATSLTGVYPVDSPGGWHLLGHCPVPMFDAAASPPALLAPGDRVRFRAVDAAEHAAIARRVGAGRFDVAALLSDAPVGPERPDGASA